MWLDVFVSEFVGVTECVSLSACFKVTSLKCFSFFLSMVGVCERWGNREIVCAKLCELEGVIFL